MDVQTYEDRFGPVTRRIKRFTRGLRWGVKGLSMRPRQIVIETRWRLGDEIMALPIYGAVKAVYPGARIAAWCHYSDLLIDHPAIDRVNDESVVPDRYICLHTGPRHVLRIEHYARCAGVPMPEEPPRLYYADWSLPPSVSLPSGDGPCLAVSSGASWPNKRWPVAAWRAVCQRLMAQGCRIVELGADGDEPIGMGASLVGKTSVREAASVLHACDLFLCCDSGLMHLALAAGTPTLALFGPTDPAILVRDLSRLSVVRTPRDCAGCWNTSTGDPPPGTCPQGHTACLEAITVDNVAAAAQRLLEKT